MRATGRSTRTSHASWASTDGVPYAELPGDAASRSPTSRCTITTQLSTLGSSSIVRRMKVAAMPYGRLATIFPGAGSSAARSSDSASPIHNDTLS